MFTTKPCQQVLHSQVFLNSSRGGDSTTNNDENDIKNKKITLNNPASDVSLSKQTSWTASSTVLLCSLFLILQNLDPIERNLSL